MEGKCESIDRSHIIRTIQEGMDLEGCFGPEDLQSICHTAILGCC
jgi:hypothetical protein